jgi:mannitol 2-dehydrogenase
VPAYDPIMLSPGILHFGVGNFHRAHQAVYLDDLFNKGHGLDWAIVGAGVMPSDTAMREKLAAQDFLTTVVEQDNNRTAARVTAPMIDIIAPGETETIIAALADPRIRIVSMTITEGGYFVDAAGAFNPGHPAIFDDGQNPDRPKTVFGLIVAGLKRRKASRSCPATTSRATAR